MATHFSITRALVDLFEALFSPAADDARAKAISEELSAALLQVSNPNDDRILAPMQTVIEATLRTNAYQSAIDGKARDYLSLKLSSRDIPFLPEPKPLYEIFVYSDRVEGVHLRGARVAVGLYPAFGCVEVGGGLTDQAGDQQRIERIEPRRARRSRAIVVRITIVGQRILAAQ